MRKKPPVKVQVTKSPRKTRAAPHRVPRIQVASLPQNLPGEHRAIEPAIGADHVLEGARRVAEAGNIAGLFDGLVTCVAWYGCGRDVSPDDAAAVKNDELGVLVPRWILRHAVKYMRNELLGTGTCPTQKWRARFIRDMQFMDTLEAVETARDRGAKWTDGRVFEMVAEMDAMSPAQVEGRYKRGMRIYRHSRVHKRFYVPMSIRAPRLRDETR
jgi:hypothetical protein